MKEIAKEDKEKRQLTAGKSGVIRKINVKSTKSCRQRKGEQWRN